MGKKLFKFFNDPGARSAGKGTPAPAGEEASRMRELIKQEYGEERIAVLQELARGNEAAARFDDEPILQQEMIAPAEDMLRIISRQTGLKVVELRNYKRADHKLRSLITAEQAKTLRVIPVEEKEDGTIVVAIADPSNPTIADDLRLILGREVDTVIANEDEINERIESYYGMGDETLMDVLDKEAQTESTEENVIEENNRALDLTDLEKLANDPPIIRLVNFLLLRAINDRASDIHVEPFPNFIRIRYRVDGVLHEIPAPPRNQLVAIISRLKVLAGMKIEENRLPQDGRIKLSVEGREIDLRVSTIPTVHGESIVMRVLDKSMMMIGISNIGMLSEVLDRFKQLIRLPNGIVLVTGPTGCGKTTTLYASLAEVRDPGEKLITTEDPVEYEMDGIQQVNINEGVGLTYARCLRAILRQDPDRVLVGEIRDVETAQIAVQAALTGHLVFSTLHTNSAAATITRMLDMGVEPFLITSALLAVIGQRLVRTICQQCKVPYQPDEEELLGFGVTRDELQEQNVQLFHGQGCAECGHSGFHGRMGIYELMELDDEIRELVLERATTDEIQEVCRRNGMTTMREDGWIKICMGLTTLGEIARQTPADTTIGAVPAGDFEDEGSEGQKEGRPALAGGEQNQLAQPRPESLPQPPPKLDAKTMSMEGEAAMPVSEAGDAAWPPTEA